MKHLKTALCSLLLAFAPFIAYAEVVSSEEIGFTIENDDGSRETAVLLYQAFVSTYCNGSGSVSTWDHPFDTRRVKWGADSWIQRDVCLVSRTIGKQCKGGWTRLFNDSRSGKSKTFNLFTGDLNHTTCGDVAGRISEARNQLSRDIISSLKKVMDKDIDETFEMMKQRGVKRVIRD